MATWASERMSAAKAGWVLVLLLAGWVAFLVLPLSRPDHPGDAGAHPPPVRDAELAAAGLPDNPDWVGLPEFFAIWANALPWIDDRVRFAYWNPASNSYSYAFEATRQDGHIRFQEIPIARLLGGGDHFDPEQLAASQAAGGEPESATHPFVFPTQETAERAPMILVPPPRPVVADAPPGQRIADPGLLPPLPLPPVSPPELPNDEPKK